MPWELPDVLDPDLAREGLKRLDPINHIARTLMPDPLLPFARVATLEVLLVHAQSAAAGCRLGGHGAFGGDPCAARRCRALGKSRGHGARHRSAECQASIAGCVPTSRRRLARYRGGKLDFSYPLPNGSTGSSNLSPLSGSAFPCCDRLDATGRDGGRILWRAGLEPCGF